MLDLSLSPWRDLEGCVKLFGLANLMEILNQRYTNLTIAHHKGKVHENQPLHRVELDTIILNMVIKTPCIMSVIIHPRGVNIVWKTILHHIPRSIIIMVEDFFIIEPRGPIERVAEGVQIPENLPEVPIATIKDNDCKSFQAGQLIHYYRVWKKMGAPDIILKLIQGYRILFHQRPPLVYPNVRKCPYQTPVSEEMSAIVQKMKSQGILVAAPYSPSFISPLFLVPKPNGSVRPIFNLKALNEYVLTSPFHSIKYAQNTGLYTAQGLDVRDRSFSSLLSSEGSSLKGDS